MSHVLHRHAKATLATATGGEGAYIFTSDGKRYLDASGGAAVSCLGHNHPVVIDAIKAQLGKLAYAHTSFFTTEAVEALGTRLCNAAPGNIDRVYFVSGGSEGMEAALKLARQYFLERGEPDRCHFIARRQSYHGNTLGALAVGGNQWRRQPFQPLLMNAEHIAPCYAYRDRQEHETEDDYGRRVADELEERILALGPETVIGFVAEPVVGATLGAVPALPGYFRRIREICDKYDVLLILDEVMCGMGRTGTLFAYEQEGIVPDLVVIAKGLGAGYQPIGALLMSDVVFETIRDGSGFFQHGHTYMGHATACAAALAVQQVIEDEDLLDNVRRQGDRLTDKLTERFGNHAHVGDIRGRGLFVGLEFVAERTQKTPFDPALKLNAVIKRHALANGLMCYPMGGTIDGRSGDHLLLAPPYIINDGHIDEIVDKLGTAVDTALVEVV